MRAPALAALALQVVIWHGPRLTPQQAADVLRTSPVASNAGLWAPTPPAALARPQVTFTGATGPTLGPWTWPPALPATRLDGTPLSQPPAIYGQLPWSPWWPHLSSGDRKSGTSSR